MNQSSIGIEHEDGGNATAPRSDALYKASALLVADLCSFYGIPISREHILMHREVAQKPTACPGTLDIERIIKMAQELSDQSDLKTYQLKEADFLNMVAEGSNFKKLLELSQPALAEIKANDPTAGVKVADYIKLLSNRILSLEVEVKDLRGQIGTLPVINDPQASNSQPAYNFGDNESGVPFQPIFDKGDYIKVKSWFLDDLFGFLGRFVDWLRGSNA
jgi:hypothetical protein